MKITTDFEPKKIEYILVIDKDRLYIIYMDMFVIQYVFVGVERVFE